MNSFHTSLAFFVLFAVTSYLTIASAQDQIFQGIRIPDQSGQVITVTGPVSTGDLGITVTHEHLFIDLAYPYDHPKRWALSKMDFPRTEEEVELWNEPFSTRIRGELLNNMFGGNRDALVLDNLEDAIAEVEDFKASGGGTIVDVTSDGLGRDPERIREVAEATGVNIVMGSGYYRTAWHPEEIDTWPINEITKHIVSDIVVGVGADRIRSGIIGEIGAENLTLVPEESNEVRVLRAAARASRLTGAAISVHNYIGRNGIWHTALDILEEEGADMSRVIMGHVTADSAEDIGFLESLLRRGVYLQFDTLGAPLAVSYPQIANWPNLWAILELIKRGYGDRILVSQDVCTKFQLHKYGGFGYDFVLTNLIPFLRDHGVSERDIMRVTQENPARVLAFVAPKSLVNGD